MKVIKIYENAYTCYTKMPTTLEERSLVANGPFIRLRKSDATVIGGHAPSYTCQ